MKNLENNSTQVLVTYGDEQDYTKMVAEFSRKGCAIKSTFQKDYVHAVFVDFKDKVVFNANVTCAAACASCGQQKYAWNEVMSSFNKCF